MVSMALDSDQAWRVLASIPDPELPALSIVDIGIVRSVVVNESGVRVAITPTFTACPAMRVIEGDIAKALHEAGFAAVSVDRVLTPPWTTDWMSDSARAKLKAYGIAPPGPVGEGSASVPWHDRQGNVPCPRCDSRDTKLVSAFGSTPCKALYHCGSCAEPFEHFKCH